MSASLFALFVMGCSSDLKVCRHTGPQPAVFQQEASCNTALEQGLMAPTNFDVTIARCIEMDDQSAQRSAAISWFVDVDGHLMIELPAPEGSNGRNTLFEAPSVLPKLETGPALTWQLSKLSAADLSG